MNFKRYHVSKNLFDISTVENGKGIAMDGSITDYEKRCSTVTPIDVSTYSNVTLSFTATLSGTKVIYALFNDSTLVTRQSAVNSGTMIDVSRGNKLYICFYDATETVQKSDLSNVMLNSGSTPLPYEPYSSEVWHDIPHYIHNTSTDTLTTLPADIYVNDNNATVGLKGNMEQSGTPTPTTPIQPSECGERTGNLFNLSAYSSAVLTNCTIAINDDILTQTNSGTFARSAWKIDNLQVGADYTMSVTINNPDKTECQIRICDSTNSTVIIVSTASKATSITLSATFTAQTTTHYVRLYSNTSTTTSNTYSVEFSEIMLNTGSAPLPYEPYGQYKIPILNNSQTTNVYLSEVETTRNIKKIVFNGSESRWSFATLSGHSGFIIRLSNTASKYPISNTDAICTHYRTVYSNRNGVIYTLTDGRCAIVDDRFTTADDFKAYLAQQYANGTPVTVWYVLATPETATINEPLMKIGDYADEVSGITIPTIAGANTISVDTTLQPSEVSATYKGWHPVADVHEYDSNYTIATMQALTIAQLQTYTISDLQGGEWS